VNKPDSPGQGRSGSQTAQFYVMSCRAGASSADVSTAISRAFGLRATGLPVFGNMPILLDIWQRGAQNRSAYRRCSITVPPAVMVEWPFRRCHTSLVNDLSCRW
jgi:hypothetical protein